MPSWIKKKLLLITTLLLPSISISANSASLSSSKNHILYLAQTLSIEKAIEAYFSIISEKNKHDVDLLEHLCQIILQKGAESTDLEEVVASLYGANLGGASSLLDLCETAIKSKNPNIQMLALQLSGTLPDDRSKYLLYKAFSSPYFQIRMEAAYYLAIRKDSNAIGYIDSLMQKIPPFLYVYFPPFFAEIGSSEAITLLKKMVHNELLDTRISAILTAAQFNRDDLLGDIRNAATHVNKAELEACYFAIGVLGDALSVKKLQGSVEDSDENVKLSALRALVHLGKRGYIQDIEKMVNKEQNLFATAVLAEMEGSDDTLKPLLRHQDMKVRLNAALALLYRRSASSLNVIEELIFSPKKDLGFHPQYSPGKSLMCWKVITSASARQKDPKYENLYPISLSLREQTLLRCLELGEDHFLPLADKILEREQKDLIPCLIELLSNLNNEKSLSLLKRYAQKPGSPFTRYYCCLALTKLKSDDIYSSILYDWIQSQNDIPIFRFRPLVAKSGSDKTLKSYELTPEESSLLFINSLVLLSETQTKDAITLLLKTIQKSKNHNRFVLTGVLLKALQ